MKNKVKVLLFTLIAITSNNSNAESIDYYLQMNEAKLCIDYMTLPSYNFNQGKREQAIQQRELNCSAYAGVAASKAQSDRGLEDALRALSNLK
jgi:hypothetical protein